MTKDEWIKNISFEWTTDTLRIESIELTRLADKVYDLYERIEELEEENKNLTHNIYKLREKLIKNTKT